MLLQLEELLYHQPERPDLIAKQADVLSLLGATGEAISQYQRALHICPDFLEATIKLGTQYLQIEADHLAAREFNKAFEINDKIVDAYIGLAKAQKLAGLSSDALVTLSLAAAIQPNSSLLFAEAATLLFKAFFSKNLQFFDSNDSNCKEAVIDAHRQEIKNQPQNPDLHYRMGILMMSIGRINNAIDSFKIALDINPTFARARSKLTICLFEAGQTDASMDLLTVPECIDKNTLVLYYKTALLYCNRVKFASSLINLDRYMEDNFTSTNSTLNISIVLQNLGLLDRVSSMWENLSETANDAFNINRI